MPGKIFTMPLDYSKWSTNALTWWECMKHPAAAAELDRRQRLRVVHLGWMNWPLVAPGGVLVTSANGLCGKGPGRLTLHENIYTPRVSEFRAHATCPECLVEYDRAVEEGWFFFRNGKLIDEVEPEPSGRHSSGRHSSGRHSFLLVPK